MAFEHNTAGGFQSLQTQNTFVKSSYWRGASVVNHLGRVAWATSSFVFLPVQEGSALSSLHLI